MTVIGITGPTGAGKTTVLNVLTGLGAVVVDCDRVYHELLSTSRPMLDELRAQFGNGIFDEYGDLCRKELGAIVFREQKALDRLNAITHRYVVQWVDEWLSQAESEGQPAAALDAIALWESGLGKRCHITVAVTAPEEVRVRRIVAREGISEAYARLRLSAQRPSVYFETRCDYILNNDGDRSRIEAQALKLFTSIILGEEI